MGVGMRDRTVALTLFVIALSLVFVGLVMAQGTLLDDFEDGDTSPKLTKWDNWDNDILVTTDDPLNGTYSGRISQNCECDNDTRTTRSENGQFSRVEALYRVGSSPSGSANHAYFYVGTNSGNLDVTFRGNGEVASNGDTISNYDVGTVYNLTFYNITYGSNGGYNLTITNTSSSNSLGDVFHTHNSDNVSNIRARVDTTDFGNAINVTFDDIRLTASGGTTISTPLLSLTNPNPTGSLTSPPSELSIDLEDSQFPNDEVELTWTLDGTQIDQFNVTSNGTYTTQLSATQGASPGQHTWNVSATDNSGQTAQSDNTYTLPQNITIRDEAEPHPVITDTVELSAFEDEDTTPFLQNQTVTNGKIDLSQFPTNSDITIVMDSGQWENRSVQLESIYAQQNVFLINESALTVDNRFLVQDRTGNFDPVETEVILEHAINKSLWSGSGNQFRWRVVSGDNLGADESYYDNLTFDERYRIKVRNNEGDTRILGEYMAEESGVVTLTIGDIVNDPDENAATVGYEVNRTNITGQPVQVNVEYNDSSDSTEEIYLEIHEQGNTSNVLVSNTTFSAGPYGEFTFVQDVPSAENGTVWVVDLDTKRTNATNVQFQDVVGPGVSGTVLDDLPGWVVAIIWVGLIFGLAGVFSQANGGLGAVVMAGVGAMVWIVGLAPPVVGGGVILLSMIVAAIVFANDRRDGGL